MRTYKIKEISQIINGATPSTTNPDFWDGEIIWLTPKDLTGFSSKYIYSGHASITKAGYDSCSTKLVPAGAILLSSRAPIGYLAIAGTELCTNQGFKSIVCNKNLANNEYLYYWLSTKVEYLQSISNGATFKELSKDTLENVLIDLPDLATQRHIVNTIGSVDNLIENINKQNEKLLHIGLTIINGLNDSLDHQKLSSICELIKGFEIGSQNYIETLVDESLIHYLRVGDLLSLGSTFVEHSNELMLCSDDDILIAFDGAPGRNAIGLEGAYSSGIYKVNCKLNYKGLIYFEINSELNQKIIKDHSQGTTILHASKAIPFLEIAKTDEQNNEKLNALFEQIIKNKKKLKLLNNEKRLLLSKYF